jgi:hypothetical protein
MNRSQRCLSNAIFKYFNGKRIDHFFESGIIQQRGWALPVLEAPPIIELAVKSRKGTAVGPIAFSIARFSQSEVDLRL